MVGVGPLMNDTFRLYGLWIYGLLGYMVNFWQVPNGTGFYIIDIFGYMVEILDMWSIYSKILQHDEGA